MISVLEACKLMTDGTDTPFVSAINDIGNCFIIATVTKTGESIDIARIIDKETKEIRVGTFKEFKKYLNVMKKVEIPEQYQVKNDVFTSK